LKEKGVDTSKPQETAARIIRLLQFWGDKNLSEIGKNNCKRYAKSRSTPSAARRELEDLKSGVNYFIKENGISGHVPAMWLPEKSLPRHRWLTRQEAARFLRTLWRARDPLTGEYTRRHVARFFLIGLYTGTRAGAICGAAIGPTIGHGYVDLEEGVFYRKPRDVNENKKRQPTCRLPDRLIAHLKRWQRIGISRRFVVEYRGNPIKSVRTAWDATRRELGMNDVMRHTLRHTAATWLMQAGTDPWEATQFLGMSLQTLLDNYAHHHPDFQKTAAENITRPPQKRHRNNRIKPEHSTTIRKLNR